MKKLIVPVLAATSALGFAVDSDAVSAAEDEVSAFEIPVATGDVTVGDETIALTAAEDAALGVPARGGGGGGRGAACVF